MSAADPAWAWADAVVGRALAKLTPAEAEDWWRLFAATSSAIADTTSPLYRVRIERAAIYLVSELREGHRVLH